MSNFLISLVLGMLPEVLFITMMTSYLEGINTKRIRLFFFNCLGYVLLIMLCRFELLFYIAYVIYLYWVLKLNFKVQITSFFMISVVFSIIAWLSFICSFFSSYCLGYIMSRIFLVVIYLYLRKELKTLYELYKSCWNRNNKYAHKIKSITLRNCSLVFINVMIIIFNIFSILCGLIFL